MSEAKNNLEKLINLLKHRLQSKGKTVSLDTNGNTFYIDCDVYSKESLESFIHLSVSEFNQTPKFTSFTLEDSKFVNCFSEALVEGATLYALSSQALLERGREFQITDHGVDIYPPSVAEMLNTQFSVLLVHHWDKLKTIKIHIDSFK